MNYDIASEILKNMGDESNAQAGYCQLIKNMESADCDTADIDGPVIPVGDSNSINIVSGNIPMQGNRHIGVRRPVQGQIIELFAYPVGRADRPHEHTVGIHGQIA